MNRIEFDFFVLHSFETYSMQSNNPISNFYDNLISDNNISNLFVDEYVSEIHFSNSVSTKTDHFLHMSRWTLHKWPGLKAKGLDVHLTSYLKKYSLLAEVSSAISSDIVHAFLLLRTNAILFHVKIPSLLSGLLVVGLGGHYRFSP